MDIVIFRQRPEVAAIICEYYSDFVFTLKQNRKFHIRKHLIKY